MSEIHPPVPVKLICGVMWNASVPMSEVLQRFDDHWGPTDFTGHPFDFDQTPYYVEEFGPGLKKMYVSFGRLVEADTIPDHKIWSNELERRFVRDGRRSVNIDPGYLADAKLVMATAKNLAHRVHIGHGVYADLQLMFRKHTFEPVGWTFPDLRQPGVIRFFNDVRTRYLIQIRSPQVPAETHD